MNARNTAPARRVFILQVAAGSIAFVAVAPRVLASEEHVNPADPYAKSMGFRLNTEEVDQVKYPRHTTEQHCSRCQLWNGGENDFGHCSFFDGAITPKNGWCKNFKVRKAAAPAA